MFGIIGEFGSGKTTFKNKEFKKLNKKLNLILEDLKLIKVFLTGIFIFTFVILIFNL